MKEETINGLMNEFADTHSSREIEFEAGVVKEYIVSEDELREFAAKCFAAGQRDVPESSSPLHEGA